MTAAEAKAERKGKKMFGARGWELFTPGADEKPNPAPRRAPKTRLEDDDIPPPSRTQERLLRMDAERRGSRLRGVLG